MPSSRISEPSSQLPGDLMKTLIECNIMLFLASIAILTFILRYRIHLQVEYRPRLHKRRHSNPAGLGDLKTKTFPVPYHTSGDRPEDATATPTVAPSILRDLESALVNLGCSKAEAKDRAAAAVEQGKADFDALILRAIQAGPTDKKRIRRNP